MLRLRLIRRAALALAMILLATGGMITTARAQADAPVPGVKGDILFWIQDAEDKLVELAGAIPEDKYSWKPSEGVRSASQVFMHVATANFGLPSFIGTKPPEGFDFRTFENSTSAKAEVIKQMQASFAHARMAVKNLKDADMDKPVDLFGNKSTVRGTAMLLVTHNHEHLGQAIAYARSINVTPPWTAREEAAMKEKAGGK